LHLLRRQQQQVVARCDRWFKGTKDDHSHVSDAAGANRAGKEVVVLDFLPDMTELNQVLSKQLSKTVLVGSQLRKSSKSSLRFNAG